MQLYLLKLVTLCEQYPLDLQNNETLNKEAAQEAGLSDEEIFSLANFTYSNSPIVRRMYYHLNNTDFLGITVSDIPVVWD